MNRYLKELEEESISFIRDTHYKSENPVVLYSIGKDSSVLLHLFRKAFHPITPPVPFLHIDTGWKFKEMIEFRNSTYERYGINIEVYKNVEGEKNNINPFEHPNYTDVMKTEALKKILIKKNYDFVFGGARRDEEGSRSKEKILSHRDDKNVWDPKKQRIEPWNLFNTKKNKGESFRVFPISNWTELNIWQYIDSQKIEIVPLYFAKNRSVVTRKNSIYLIDDARFKLQEGEVVETKSIRFRTLGCYPLTTGIESKADTIKKIIDELDESQYSERSGRLIDYDKIGSMELKKREGYF